MSRSRREAELAALYGDRYPAVVVSQMGARKRDRKKLLSDQIQGSYASGSFSSPQAWEAGVRGGAASRLFNPDARSPSGLRGMTSQGSLGHMFAGGSAEQGLGISGMPSAPVPGERPAPRGGPDFYGLRTPGMGAMRQYQPTGPAPQAQAPRAPVVYPPMPPRQTMEGPPAGWTTTAPRGPGYVAPGDYGQGIPGPQHYQGSQSMNIARGLASPRGLGGFGGMLREGARRGQAKNFMGPVQPYQGGFEKGTLPSYQEGTLAHLLYGGSDKFRENFKAMPEPLKPGGMATSSPDRLQRDVTALAPLGQEVFSALEGGRIGAEKQVRRIEELLGRRPTQNDLAGIQRFFEGRRIAKDFGAMAPLVNRGFEAAKAFSQRRGWDRIGGPAAPLLEALPGIGPGDLDMGTTTSTASPANVQNADLGIQSYREGLDRFQVPGQTMNPHMLALLNR